MNSKTRTCRWHGRSNSISGIIRYLGAEKDSENGQIKADTIVKALELKMGVRTSVDPATVLGPRRADLEGRQGEADLPCGQ